MCELWEPHMMRCPTTVVAVFDGPCLHLFVPASSELATALESLGLIFMCRLTFALHSLGKDLKLFHSLQSELLDPAERPSPTSG